MVVEWIALLSHSKVLGLNPLYGQAPKVYMFSLGIGAISMTAGTDSSDPELDKKHLFHTICKFHFSHNR